MNLSSPVLSTQITFPGSSVYEETRVLHSPWNVNETQCAIFTEKTPFHPVDYQWPDQPADQGWAQIAEKKVAITDCLVAARHENNIYLGKDIPVNRGCEGWEFLVAHIVNNQDILELEDIAGCRVLLQVDESFRNKISRAHTAAHLMSLALNKAMAPYWKKIPMTDALGSPHFDMLAIESASLTAHRSQDTYRFGKSIRKKGLNVDGVLEDIVLIEKNINQFLAEILSQQPKVSIDPPASLLHARREWRCQWGDINVSIPCGGTHLLDEEVSGIEVSLSLDPENNQFLEVRTIVITKEEKNGVTSREFIEAL